MENTQEVKNTQDNKNTKNTIKNIKAIKTPTIPKTTETPKVQKEKLPATVEITCVDCGKKRTVGRGEAFQVKRCVECQEKHKKELRKQYRKNRGQALKDRIAVLEKLLTANKIAIPA